ncbi:FAD-dependent oxidoreductase [Jiangella mangrovi]|uniref:2-polyprenyl-6-methoxyphenol hydroxylase-like FAD-dependent oxidoreductase n=1 Tax=Jiangella mangrovi TaxID=1524084 RepID=A0A7W9GUR5_9ACTN|nr:2-polyprenyl-6-methoxyphenol hydroxylase-like FAD-dependent oxidoreductase [Jiangella mangrovi]
MQTAVTNSRAATTVVRRGAGRAEQTVEADLCVIGAGISGVSAALEAARLGRRVALVDGLSRLGGQAVNSVIGTFAGLLSNGPSPYQFTYGIASDILRDLGASGDLRLRPRFNTVMYDEAALARWIDERVHAAGITVLLGSVLRGVERDGRRVRAVDLASRYGDVRVLADGFVDASGDAVIACNADLPCRQPAEGQVYGSQKVVLEGIDEARYPATDELLARLAEKGDQYGVARKDGLANLFRGRGRAVLNMTHTETPLETVQAAQKAFEGKVAARRAVQFLQSEFPEAFGAARVRSFGLLGIRQTRWIVGRTQLTTDDLLSARRFPDAIARTGWGIELHDQLETSIWEPLPEGHVHYIPFGSLTPPDVDNLVAAGRCIDGDVAALSSVRVMGPCIATGSAAAHALDLADAGSVHDIDLTALQQRLNDNLHRTDPYIEP